MEESRSHAPDEPSPEVLLALRLVPGVGNALAQYVIDRGARRAVRAESFVEDASTAADLDPEALLRRIMEDPRLSELFETAVSAAVASASSRKRRALARLMSGGLLARDDAEVDLTELLLNTVSRLEVAEVKLLDVMRKPPQDIRGPINPGTPMNIELLTSLHRGSPRAVEILVPKLEAAGLIKDISAGKVGEQAWIVTAFGQSVHGFLGDDEDGP